MSVILKTLFTTCALGNAVLKTDVTINIPVKKMPTNISTLVWLAKRGKYGRYKHKLKMITIYDKIHFLKSKSSKPTNIVKTNVSQECVVNFDPELTSMLQLKIASNSA